MIISIIAAMDESRLIGVGNRLPFRLPSDMRRFRRITMGHHVLMGRNTFESIRRPLPGRIMIVLSRNPSFRAECCVVFSDLQPAVDWAAEREETELFIIGGNKVYQQALNLANRIYLTRVHTIVQGDTFFPELKMDYWQSMGISLYMRADRDEYWHTFQVLQKIISCNVK